MVDPLTDTRRTDPPWNGAERPMLEAWLEYHRMTLLLKCEGLDDEGRKNRPVPSSLMSLHGLIRHMAEVERNWFRRGLDQQDLPQGIWWTDAEPDRDFAPLDDADWDADLATWQRECETARAIAARHDLNDTFHSPRRGVDIALRWVYLHMIEEYARHNGHADLIRECVDGAVGE